MMRVSVDFDGTLAEYVEIYKQLISALRKSGHEVGILTGRNDTTIEDDTAFLRKYGIEVDFFINTESLGVYERLMIEWSERGLTNMNRDDIACIWKARMFGSHHIDMHFDDAADKIRQYMQKGHRTLLLKSPTPHNGVIPKWENDDFLTYKEKTDATVATKGANS